MWKTSLYDTTKLTVELRELVESGVKLWDFDYPSFYEGDEKKAFEQKVIDHFYFRQIGQETVGRFLHMFRARVREIMPRYIDMYKSVKLMQEIDDPFGNVDITETFTQDTSGSTTGKTTTKDTVNGSSSLNSEHRFSNTPQGEISNIEKYMTEASKDNQQTTNNNTVNGENNTNNTSTGKTEYTLTKKGNQGVNTYAHDIIEFRQSIIDVDTMIINDLNCLFLGVY